MTRVPNDPRTLTRTWSVVLLAPAAWAASLGILYSLTDEVCAHGGRAAMATVSMLCLALAAAPAPIAWWRRRKIAGNTAAGERLRFLLEVALGGSVIFTLVTLVSALPVFWMGACRT
jgi:succinate dehydrogenase hydrophobic anchor subunit